MEDADRQMTSNYQLIGLVHTPTVLASTVWSLYP